MKTTLVAISLALIVPSFQAGADTAKDAPKTAPKTTKKLGADEVQIVAHLHHVNMMEIDLGKLAVKTATAPVKKYGQMLVDDHTSADKDLVTFAKGKGLFAIPAEAATTEADKAAAKEMMDSMAALKKLKGADFDREYLRMMVNGHDQELAKSDALISTSQDDDLDKIIEARKATLTRHSDAAKELQKSTTQAAK